MSASIVLEVLQHCKLHGAQRAVLSTLAAYVDAYGPHVFPSLDTLARSADISRRHIQRCLHALEQQGYIDIIRRKEPGKNARNFYQVLFPWRVPAQKSRDTKMALEDLKKTKEREKRSGSADIPRQIPPEVLAYPKHIDWVNSNLTLGSAAYAASLSDYTPTPVPVVHGASQAGYIFQEKYVRDLVGRHFAAS